MTTNSKDIQNPGDIEWREFASIYDINFPPEGLHQLRIHIKGVPFELLVKSIHSPKNIIVFGQSALSTRLNLPLPVYHRWTWFNDFPESVCVALNDPTLYLNDSILGGWFQGTSDHFYMEDGAKIVGKIANYFGINNSKIFFYGSSAGGFSSLMMAAQLHGASAIAEIPQTNMARYHVLSALNNLSRHCYNGVPIQEILNLYPERISVLEQFKKLGHIPNIMYLQNVSDTLHLENHLFPFIFGLDKLLSDEKFKNSESRRIIEFYQGRTEKGDGHVAAPRKFTIRAIKTAIQLFSS